MIAVVMVDDPKLGGGPGTVPEALRLWVSYSGCKVGDRVKPSGVIVPV